MSRKSKAVDAERLNQLIRYAGTAGVAALVDLGGFLALQAAGLSVLVSAALSFLVATVANYLLSARFVFQARTSWSGYRLFLVAAITGFLVNVAMTVASSTWLGAPPFVAKTIGIGVAFFANFTLNSAIVFRRQSH